MHLKSGITSITRYHGARQTVEIADRGDAMVWICLPLNSEIPANPHMLSGKYQKQVNGVSVADEVIISVNDDYSFTITEHTSSLMDALTLLQAQVATLLNQTHSHP